MHAPDHFDALRATALDLLTGGEVDAGDPVHARPMAALSERAAEWLAVMAPGRLWADLPLEGRPGNVTGGYARLRTIATAWATPGTAQHGDDAVADAVVAALDLLYERHYNEELPETGNWWFWEIGTPAELARLCVLLGDRLDAGRSRAYLGAIDRFCPDADRRAGWPEASESGSNRADKASIVALRGVAGRSAEKLALARDGLSDVRGGGRHSVFRYVDEGDGFYRDGSFVQHGCVAYTGSYGLSLLIAVSETMALLHGSPWAITDPGRRVVLDAVERSFAPFVHDGRLMDTVRGRAATRQAFSDEVAGHAATGAVLLLAGCAREPYRSRFRALAKGWIERCPRPYLEHATVPETRRAIAVLDDKGVEAATGPFGHFAFPSMDRVVHRRPGWSFAVGMSSRRVAAYEAINGENRHGWHTGDGMTYLYTSGPDRSWRDFWPTVDPHRLPGVTVAPREREDLDFRADRPDNAWAGGVVLGPYGLASMEVIGADLRARKSWLCLDAAVVALGAGITGSGRVETVVDNRATEAEPSVGDGWVHLDGTGGYLVDGARVAVETRTGCWRDINTGDDTAGAFEPVTRRYVRIWLDHGTDPEDASYAYVLLPNAARSAPRRPPARVLADTGGLQAVRAGTIFGATFWAPGTAGPVTADAPCAVLLRREGERITLAVADPSRTVDAVTLTLATPARGVAHADGTVTVRPGTRPVIRVALGGSLGRSHAVELTTYARRSPQDDR